MRTAAGWSLGRLAGEAGVDKSTLSRWESGRRMPCIPELEAVMDALGAPPDRCAVLLAALAPPRAARRLAVIAPVVGLPTPPVLGDLLRALRLRRGVTQEMAASMIGVSRTVITRWERGARFPSTEERQALCYHLGASETEMVALTTVVEPRAPADAPAAWEDRRAEIAARLGAVNNGQYVGQEELQYLLLEQRAWNDALLHDDARPVLAMIYAHHGHYLRLEERWRDSRPIAERALALASEPGGDLVAYLRAALLNAVVLSHAGSAPGRTAALRLLRQVAAQDGAPPEYAAWTLSEMAECLVRAGQADAAVSVARQARRVAAACENPVELYLRRCDLSERLVDAGRPLDALRLAPDPPGAFAAADQLPSLLLFARAHHAAGNPAEAHSFLQSAMTLADGPALRRWRHKAEVLASGF